MLCSKMKAIRLLFLIITVALSGIVTAQVTFVVEQLPKSTPQEDTIFISGDFNNWVVNDPRFMLRKRLDGKFAITLHIPQKIVQYKFHRGGWAKVETNARNEYVPNRETVISGNTTVPIAIDNWQDAGGARPFDVLIFYFFAVAFAGLVFAWLLFSRASDKKQNQEVTISWFVIFLSVVLFGRVFFEVSSLRWQYDETLVGEILLLLSGPLWYAVLRYDRLSSRSILYHVSPAIVAAVIVALKIFNVSYIQFLSAPVLNKLVTWNTILLFGSGMLSNAGYFFPGWKIFIGEKEDYESTAADQRFIRQHIALGLVFVLLLLAKFVLLLSDQEHVLLWFDRDVIFIYFTAVIFAIGFYAIKRPVFSKTPALSSFKPAELAQFKKALEEVMRTQKSYRNPHLTLNELSDIVNIKPHVLSKVINECYQQNFRDYLNRYRVEEFIAIAQQDSNKRFTFLALANEVGFNSKSTFNAAFKKVTQQSPRDFFRAHRELAID
jgi:AraC-like DNA-binding protein